MKWGIAVFSLMFEYIMGIFTDRIKRKSTPPFSKNKERKSIQILKKKYKATRFPTTPKNKSQNNNKKRFTYKSQAYEYSKKRVAKAQGRPFARFRSR